MGKLDLFPLSLVAKTDLSAKQYCVVKLASTADRQIELCGDGEKGIGILQDKPIAGQAGNVGALGLYPVKYGGTVTRDDILASDANGNLVTWTDGDYPVAYALSSGSSGEIHDAFVFPGLQYTVPSAVPATKIADGSVSNTEFQFLNAVTSCIQTQLDAKLSQISIPVADMSDLTNASKLLTDFLVGYAGEIAGIDFIVTDPVTTASKDATITITVDDGATTGGVLSLTSANCAAKGAVVSATALTAGEDFEDDEVLDLLVSASAEFTEGAGVLVLKLKQTA